MRYIEENNLRILVPDDGKWLYNGEACSDLVYLGINDSIDNWHEVDEYIDHISDEEASAEDYENALGRFGV